ncbi:glycosyltransferase family A protein [Sphingomonas sp. I4]
MSDDYRRLVSSLQMVAGQVDLTLITLFQRPDARAMRAIAALPGFVRPMTSDTRMSLSQARNRILRTIAAEEGFADGSLVLFPDDDCWFTDTYLPMVGQMFVTDPQLQYWFCRYGSSPAADQALFGATHRARASDVVRRSSSITLVIRGSLMARVGLFDEGLGVGTALNGGEDTDFAVRLYRSGAGAGLWSRADRASGLEPGQPGALLRRIRDRAGTQCLGESGAGGRVCAQADLGLVAGRQAQVGAARLLLGLRALRRPGVRSGVLPASLSLKG